MLERRTRLALTAPDRGLEAAAPAAALMAGALDWDADRTRARGRRLARARGGRPRRRGGARRRPRAGRVRRGDGGPRGDGAADDACRGGAGHDELVLGLDQGTSSTRCVVLDEALRERGVASVAVESSFPAAGLVEQDPEAIAASAERAIAGALAAAGARPGRRRRARHRQPDRDVRGLGPRDRRARAPRDRVAGPADRRRVRRAARARGVRPRAHRARARRHLPGDEAAPAAGRARPRRTELAYGDVASWLLHRLGGVHVSDAGNAARSLLCPLGGADWDDELLELFGIPRALLPPIADTDRIEATIAGVPVRAAIGDQQASLFGLRCWEPGAAKVTLGTGAFVLAHAGEAPPEIPPGVLGSTAWRREGTTSYALEGFIPTAGAAVDWFARLGVLPPPQSSTRYCARRATTRRRLRARAAGPRQPELGRERARRPARPQPRHHAAPTSRARSSMASSTRSPTRSRRWGRELWVDGGLSRSDWIVQRLADLAGVGVRRTARADSTALGAATLAGLAAGVWPSPRRCRRSRSTSAPSRSWPRRSARSARPLGPGARAQRFEARNEPLTATVAPSESSLPRLPRTRNETRRRRPQRTRPKRI